MPSLSLAVDAETPHQSEQAELHGHRALTPLISGAVSGGLIGTLWIIGFLICLYRRWRGYRAARLAGLRSHRELDILPPKPERYIIPPDPAIIQGLSIPGERLITDGREADVGHPRHVKPVPPRQTEENAEKKEAGERTSATHAVSPPEILTSDMKQSASTAHDRPAARSLSPPHSFYSSES